MRRLFLSVLVAGGLAVLAACSGQSGYGFSSGGNNNGSVDRITFTNGSGGIPGEFFLAPGAGAIQINATGEKGPQNVVVADALFTWSAAITNNTAVYQNNISGQTATCNNPASTPAVPLYVFNPLSATGVGGATSMPVLYDGRSTNIIYVGSPPAGITAPYCIQVIATASNGVTGGVVIRVSN